MSASKKIDQAFSKFPGQTREIVDQIRQLIHETDPSIHENWKWGPAFEKNGLLFGLWGFKKHVSFVFYRGAEMSDKFHLFNDGFNNAHNRMIKFTSLKEVNKIKLSVYIKEAVKIDSKGKTKLADTIEKAKKKITVPEELMSWLNKHAKAKANFETMAFTYQKEMIQLIVGAKQEETKKRRLTKIKAALLAGKKTI